MAVQVNAPTSENSSSTPPQAPWVPTFTEAWFLVSARSKAQLSLSCALHQPVLSPTDYPMDQPLEHSTSSRRKQVGAASIPWSRARDRRIHRAPSPIRSSSVLSPCLRPRQDSTPGGRTDLPWARPA